MKRWMICRCFLFLALASCGSDNSKDIDIIGYLERVDQLSSFDSKNYRMDEISSSFIAFGIPDDDKALENFDLIMSNREEAHDLIKKRRAHSAQSDSILNVLRQEKTLVGVRSLYIDNLKLIQENLFSSRIEQEVSIVIINRLLEESNKKDLGTHEFIMLRDHILVLDKNNFPDIIFMSKALWLAKEEFSDSELKSIVSNLKNNAESSLINCIECFSTTNKRQDGYEYSKEKYFINIKKGLSLLN